jgi:hypothetical protein
MDSGFQVFRSTGDALTYFLSAYMPVHIVSESIALT